MRFDHQACLVLQKGILLPTSEAPGTIRGSTGPVV